MNAWGELSDICKKIHHSWYVRKEKCTAQRYLKRLAYLLENLPEDDDGMGIVRAEGRALLHELSGNLELAIKFRKREIQLMERLHAIVKAEKCSEELKESILVDRDVEDLELRRKILKELEGGLV